MAKNKLTPLALAVLELLDEKPMHPYEMAQVMGQRHIEARAKLKAGSLYHTVERLQQQGFTEIVGTERDGRRPERTVYGITKKGAAAFRERALELLTNVADEYPEYASGLAVLDDLDQADVLDALRTRVVHLAGEVAAAEEVTNRLTTLGLPPIYWLDWRFHAARERFELEWTERLIDDLADGRIPWQSKVKKTHQLTDEPEDIEK